MKPIYPIIWSLIKTLTDDLKWRGSSLRLSGVLNVPHYTPRLHGLSRSTKFRDRNNLLYIRFGVKDMDVCLELPPLHRGLGNRSSIKPQLPHILCIRKYKDPTKRVTPLRPVLTKGTSETNVFIPYLTPPKIVHIGGSWRNH